MFVEKVSMFLLTLFNVLIDSVSYRHLAHLTCTAHQISYRLLRYAASEGDSYRRHLHDSARLRNEGILDVPFL